MLPIDKLKEVRVIISHEGCPDGIAAAMFVHDVLPNAEIRFLQYSTPDYEALNPEPGMLFCDFSPSSKRYKEFVDAGAIVLDHHKFAQEVVAAFGELGVFGDEVKDPGVCGAYLAYREVWLPLRTDAHPDEKAFAEQIAKLSGIRDTWQRSDLKWDEACMLAETIKFYPVESWLASPRVFSPTMSQWWDARISTGRLLVERTQKTVKKATEKAYRFTTEKGTRVVMFSGTRLSSDAAEHLGSEADLVVGFDYFGLEDGLAPLVFSTRSRGDFNCGQLCKAFGGGGHTKAAGFTTKFHLNQGSLDPYSTFKRLLHKYESGDPKRCAIVTRPDGLYETLVWSALSPDPRAGVIGTLDQVRQSLNQFVRVGSESLGTDENGNPKYPNAVEVWV